MKPEPTFSQTFRIPVSDADFTKKVKLSAVLNYFQQIAGEHAEMLGFGYQSMTQIGNLAWVLVRIRVDMIRFPGFGEEIAAETWPCNMDGLTYRRDFLMKDPSGNLLCAGVSSWVIIDTATRKIRRAPLPGSESFRPVADRAIDAEPDKIRPVGEKRDVYTMPVGVSLIDLNGHVNNARYADFIMDCFDEQTHRMMKPSSIRIHYANETVAGDCIRVFRYDNPDCPGEVFVEGVSNASGKTLFLSQVIF